MRAVDAGRKRSGKHSSPVIRLVCPAEAVELIDQAAERQIESRSAWVRGVLAIAVAQQLGIDEAETVSLFDNG